MPLKAFQLMTLIYDTASFYFTTLPIAFLIYIRSIKNI